MASALRRRSGVGKGRSTQVSNVSYKGEKYCPEEASQVTAYVIVSDECYLSPSNSDGTSRGQTRESLAKPAHLRFSMYQTLQFLIQHCVVSRMYGGVSYCIERKKLSFPIVCSSVSSSKHRQAAKDSSYTLIQINIPTHHIGAFILINIHTLQQSSHVSHYDPLAIPTHQTSVTMVPPTEKRKGTATPEGARSSTKRQTLGVPSNSEPPSLTNSSNGSPASKQLRTPPHGGTRASRAWGDNGVEWLWTECKVLEDTFGQGTPLMMWVQIDEGEDPVPVEDYPEDMRIYLGVEGKDKNWKDVIITMHLRRVTGGVSGNEFYSIAFIFLGREGRSKVEELLARGIQTNLFIPTPA